MTKKDFQVIAATIGAAAIEQGISGPNAKRRLAEHFADALAPLNPRFKRELFIQAATGQVAVTARKARTFSEADRAQFRAALGAED